METMAKIHQMVSGFSTGIRYPAGKDPELHEETTIQQANAFVCMTNTAPDFRKIRTRHYTRPPESRMLTAEDVLTENDLQ